MPDVFPLHGKRLRVIEYMPPEGGWLIALDVSIRDAEISTRLTPDEAEELAAALIERAAAARIKSDRGAGLMGEA